MRWLAMALGVALGAEAALAAPALPTDAALVEQLRALVGPDFHVRETDHFTILFDTSYEVLRDVVQRMEATFDAVWGLCTALELEPHPPAERLVVILFDQYEDYAAHARALGVDPAGADGFYHHRTNRAVFCNTYNRPDFRALEDQLEKLRGQLRPGPGQSAAGGGWSAEELRALRQQLAKLQAQRDRVVRRVNQLVLQHEIAHQVLFNVGVHTRGAYNPTWLSEGLATQFEVLQGRTAAGVLRVNHVRLGDWRAALALEPRAGRLDLPAARAALAGGPMTPLRDLVTRDELFRQADQALTYRYAEAWALLLYLHRTKPAALAAYIRESAGRPGAPSPTPADALGRFEKAFGPIDADFEAAWLTYLVRLPYNQREALR